METTTIDKDIRVLYVTAKSFPDGVMEAYQHLQALVPVAGRPYYGISRPENGVIVYRAGVEEAYEGEAEKLNCDTVVLKKGKYLCVTIRDFMKDLPAVGRTFSEMLAEPGIDPEGYCVEVYATPLDVQCMVRLQDK